MYFPLTCIYNNKHFLVTMVTIFLLAYSFLCKRIKVWTGCHYKINICAWVNQGQNYMYLYLYGYVVVANTDSTAERALSVYWLLLRADLKLSTLYVRSTESSRSSSTVPVYEGCNKEWVLVLLCIAQCNVKTLWIISLLFFNDIGCCSAVVKFPGSIGTS